MLIPAKASLQLFTLLACSFISISQVARASNITLQGVFTSDDQVQLFDLIVATAGTVDIRSYGYTGGTTSTGTVVSSGGFDTILTLFSASGVFLSENDDGVATDPSTGMAADARITTTLTPGNYIVALSQYDNFSIGNLADGFAETGHPNFTAEPGFANGGACAGNMFRDISGTDGRCRTGNWALDLVNVAGVTAVPEPSALLLSGLALALLLIGRLRNRRKATLLAAGFVAALSTVPVQAQSNPDFTNVNDILHGNRTLLNITDLEIVTLDPNVGPVFTQITTSNSSQTSSRSFDYNLQGIRAVTNPAPNFSAHMFNQPSAITITTLNNFSSNGVAYNVAFWLQGIANAGGIAAWTPVPPGYRSVVFCGAAADFTQDGYDDLALGLEDGTILIVSPNNTNPLSQPFEGGFHSGQIATQVIPTAMAAGDFNGDGRQELAVLKYNQPISGAQELVIYTVDPNSLTPVQASSIVLSTPDASYGNPIFLQSMARGKFNTTSHDQLVVALATLSGPPIVDIIDFAANSLIPIQASSLTASTVTIPDGYLEVKTGPFALPNNPYDQIAFHESSTNDNGRFFEILAADPTNLNLTAHSGITYDQFPCAAGIQVGNFDHQQPDPLNPGKNEHNPNAQIALLYCNSTATNYFMNIYSADPTTFNVNSSPDSLSPLPTNLSPTTHPARFVATDFQGRSMMLGEPTKVTINNTSPTVINAVPPMHIDYINPVGGSKPQVLNLSYIPDGFNSSFTLTQESTTGGSTTHTLSWSAGVDASAQLDYTIGDPDKGTGATYSAGFHFASEFTGSSDNSTINYSTTDFDASKTAKTADVVIYDDSRLNIWVYPVIGQTVCPAATPNCSADQQKPLTIQFSGPDQIDTGSVSADLLSVAWYQPPWEWGNVLSYPATRDQLALIYPDLANDPNNQIQLSNGLTFDTDNSSTEIQDTWSSSTEQGSTSSLANNTSFDVTLSTVDAAGVTDVAGTKFSASLNLSGSVGFSKLQTNSAKINASNGIGIQAVGKFLDPGNYAYEIDPFILGNFPPSGVSGPAQQPQAQIQTFGPLKTAFTADPLQTGAWWAGGPYSSAPDVALNHPSRWVLTNPSVGNTLPSNCRNTGKGASDVDCADIAHYYDDNHQPLSPWISEFLAMRGFFITRADNPGAGPRLGFATAGDKLDLAVRVYNYSLTAMATGTQVHVRFYAMPVDGAGNSLGDSFLIGENAVDPIPPFDDSKTDLNWRVVHAPTPFDTTGYAGKFFAFWVVVWMEESSGLVKEIEGHGLTSIPGTLTKPSDVPLEMATATDGATIVSYSNNVGFYHYAFPVLAPQNQLGAPPPDNPADVSLKNVSAAKKHIKPGELNEITAVLRPGFEGARRLKVYFYDGDPGADGRLIAIETAWLEPRTITKVRIPYHAPSDGVHSIWAVINKGKPYQTERHTSAIIVGRAVADPNNTDGDDPPDQKTKSGLQDN